MLITTDRKAALADRGNRAAAREQLLHEFPRAWADWSNVEVTDYVDDLIHEWIDELAHDLEQGITP